MDKEHPHSINISVKSSYIPQQSDPALNQYVFIYTVTISNRGSQAAKLLGRHWFITNAHGETQEVQGVGVVGEQPYLKPGDTYVYTSGTILNTPVGSMYGTYQMIDDDGKVFEALIPAFSLSTPDIIH